MVCMFSASDHSCVCVCVCVHMFVGGTSCITCLCMRVCLCAYDVWVINWRWDRMCVVMCARTVGTVIYAISKESHYNTQQLHTVNATISYRFASVCLLLFVMSNVWICGVKSSRALIRSEDQLWPVTDVDVKVVVLELAVSSVVFLGSLLLKQFWCGISDLCYIGEQTLQQRHKMKHHNWQPFLHLLFREASKQTTFKDLRQ